MINSVSGVNSAGSASTDFTFGQSQNTQTNNVLVDNNDNNVETSKSQSKTAQAVDIVELGSNVKNVEQKKIEDQEKEKRGKDDLSDQELSEITKNLNQLAEKMNFGVKFNYCEKLDCLTTQIIEKKTNKVLKEFPPKEMLNVLTRIHDWIGIILDKKA
jgi:flagellar protein FlaG